METRISKLEEDKAGLEKEVSDLKRSCEMIEKRAAEQKVGLFTHTTVKIVINMHFFICHFNCLFRLQTRKIMRMRLTS